MLGGILTIGLIAVCIAIITANERRKRIFVQRPTDDPFEDAVGDGTNGDWPAIPGEMNVSHFGTDSTWRRNDHVS
jgi:hypothetical protein